MDYIDYKELYEATFKYAKQLYDAGSYDNETLEAIFPSLKESEGERMRKIAIEACKYMVDNFENSTRRYEEAIAWLEKQGEQKYAWSEEDEKVIHCLEYTIKHFYEDEDTIKWCCDWLKSLKERYTWKPSDVQMNAVKDAIDYLSGDTKIVRKHLMSLYDQLKKLKG